MSGTGRISLRARLVILLIAVTAAFLLIMGAVTTLVLTRQLSGQFNADLAAAALSPAHLRGNTASYLAAAISRRTGTMVPVTSGALTADFEQALKQLARARPPSRVRAPAVPDHPRRRHPAAGRRAFHPVL